MQTVTDEKMPGQSQWKSDFPFFIAHPELVYLDSAATALKPQPVIDAVNDYYVKSSVNVHRGLYKLSEETTAAYEAVRENVRGFINAASTREVIFTSGTTESINIIARTWARQNIRRGEEIVVSILDHHSNIVPWQMLSKEVGCTVQFIDCDANGELNLEHYGQLLSRRTRLVSLPHVSNVLGTVNHLRPMIQKAYAIGAKVMIDAAQSAGHMPIDVEYLNCDFLAFSGHKIGGPTGVGILYGREKLLEATQPLFGGGDMIREVHTTHATWNDLPWKFEAGTPAIAEVLGLGAAITYLRSIGLSVVRAHEKEVMSYALTRLAKISGITIYGPKDAARQNGAISFSLKGIHPHDIAALLDQKNIAIRAGHHCAMPLMERLGVPATARASFGLYSSKSDIDALVEGLEYVIKTFA